MRKLLLFDGCLGLGSNCHSITKLGLNPSFKIQSIIVIAVLFLGGIESFSQNPFRTKQSGNWNTSTTWEEDTGGGFAATLNTPSVTDGAISILNGHTVTVTADVTIDQTTVNSGGVVTVNSGFTLKLNDDFTSSPLTVSSGGIVNVAGTLDAFTLLIITPVVVDGSIFSTGTGSVNSGDNSLMVFNSGSSYSHQNATGGSVPLATWDVASSCIINGMTAGTTAPGNLGGVSQGAFGNFTWNCPAQSATISLGGQLTNVQGTLRFQNSNSKQLKLNDTGAGYTLFVGVDLLNQGVVLTLTSAATSASTVTVSRDFTQTGGNLIFKQLSNFNARLEVGRNFSKTAGSFAGGSGSGIATLALNGGGATQLYTMSGTAPSNVNYEIISNSVVDAQTFAFAGTGVTFYLQSGSTLKVGSTHASGAIQNAPSTFGNITVSGTRTYDNGTTIIYNGLAAQTIGNGQPSSSGIVTRINNTSNVALSASLVIVGTLILDAGNLSILDKTLTLNGTYSQCVTCSLLTTTSSNISIGGSGAFGTLTLSGSTTINSFSLGRSGGGSVTLGSDMGIVASPGSFTQTAGDLTLNGHSLTISGDFSQTGGQIVADAASQFIINGGGTLPASITLGGSAINTITINRSSPTSTIASALSVTNLNLLDGVLANSGSLTMASGGLITRTASGSMSGSGPIASPSYNVLYTNTSAITTGIELPTGTSGLTNLTKTSGGLLTLGSPITVNGTLSLGGNFDSAGKTIDIRGTFTNTVAPTLTAGTVTFTGTTFLTGVVTTFGNLTIVSGTLTPSTNYQINGVLTNNGSLVNGALTTSFGGTSSLAGSSTTTFNNLSIVAGGTFTPIASGTFNVAGVWTNDGTFVANNSTVVFSGTNSIAGSSSTNFDNVQVTGTLTGPASMNVVKAFTNSGTFNAGAVLNVGGNFTNSSTFNAGTGTVVMNGSTFQNIQGASNANFNNLSSSNASTVTVTTSQSLTGALTLSGGVFNANGNLTLISNASGDARIAQITGGATITGNIIVQRYLPNTNVVKAYRYIASPVTTGVASSWKAKFPITGTFVDPSTQAEWPAITGLQQANPSMYIYNEAHLGATLLEDKFETFPPNGSTSTSTTLVNGKGYAGFVRQTAPITLDVTGPAAQGSVPVGVTAQSGGGIDGWNLIGNPYAAPINWANVTIPAGVGSQISFKDNTNNIGIGAGAYVYYTQGGVGIPVSFLGTIPSGQGFWVHATSTTTINFKEADKQAVSNPQFIRSAPLNVMRVNLSGNGKADEMVILFVDGGNDASDNTNDALKLKNDYINLSSLSSDGKKMAINGMGTLSCLNQVSMVVEGVTPGAYAFNFSQFDSFPDLMKVQVMDAFTGTSAYVSQANPIYNFAVTSDPASFGSNRFKINFGEAIPNIAAVGNSRCDAGAVAIIASGAAEGNYRWYNVASGGTPIIGATASTYTTPSLSQTSTYYVAAANSSGCEGSRIAVVATVNAAQPSTLFAVNNARCNPGTVTITASGTQDGSYRWYDTATGGTAIAGATAAAFTTPALNKTQTYYVTTPGAGGCEQLRIAVVANVTTLDPVVITASGKNLQSSYQSGNQWYLNGQPISGATGQTLEPQQSGIYKVTVTSSNCTTSTEHEFAVTGLEEGLPSHISISPNPTKGNLSVAVESSNEVSAKVVSLLGTTLQEKLLEGSSVKRGSFNLEEQSEGMYILIVQDGSQVYKTRIIKKQ